MPRALRRPRVLLIGLCLLASAGCAAGETGEPSTGTATTASHERVPAVPRARVDRFDSARAMALIARQVGYGPRPAGSPALARLATDLRARLPRGRFEAVPGRPAGMRNIVGHLPGRGKAVLVGAHHDTLDIPDFVGANDGAAGTAVVVELARTLARSQRACSRPLRFVLFDGEEAPPGSGDFYSSGLRGSRAYAARHARALASVTIADFVGNHGLRLPRETGSDPRMWARLRAAARTVGVGAVFPNEVTGEVLDDHTPFARRGIPAIDLIDFSYRHFHRPGDDLSAISERSIDATGETLALFLRREADRNCR